MIERQVMIFDMDGTLIDSMRLWRESYKEFLAGRGLSVPPAFFQESSEKLYTRRTVQLILAAYPQLGMDEETCYEEFLKLITRHYRTDTLPKEGVPELLSLLKGRGKTLVLATATREDMALQVLSRLDLLHFFDRTYYATGVSKSKPEYFERIASELGVETGNCLVFEDALYAMQGAKAAGCGVYAVRERYFEYAKGEIMALSDRYLDSCTELVRELEAEA